MDLRTATATWLLFATLVACSSEREQRLANLRPMEPRGERQEVASIGTQAPPIGAIRFQPARPRVGRGVTAIVEVSGPRTPQLKYEWTLNGDPIDGLEAIDLASARPGDRLEVTVTPMLDGRAGTPSSHSARVAGLAPRISGVRFDPPRDLTAGSTVTARPILDDADESDVVLQYSWSVNGREAWEREATFSTDGLRRGDRVSVEVVARLGADVTPPYRSEELVLVNASPTLEADPLQRDADGTLRTRLHARDPDGDEPVSFALKRAPAGMEIDARTGEITWAPGEAARGRHVVEIEVSDSQGGVTHSKFDLNFEHIQHAAAPAPR